MEKQIVNHPEEWEQWMTSAGSRNTIVRIRRVFVDSLHLNVREDHVAYEQMLEEVALLDSIALLEFVTAVEQEFAIKMEPELLDFDFLKKTCRHSPPISITESKPGNPEYDR